MDVFSSEFVEKANWSERVEGPAPTGERQPSSSVMSSSVM
ncbi:MAG: hypothetical protein ACI9C1_003180, partial [Candidatus Aldehydirespiratoraceae bacterium]